MSKDKFDLTVIIVCQILSICTELPWRQKTADRKKEDLPPPSSCLQATSKSTAATVRSGIARLKHGTNTFELVVKSKL